MRVFLKSESEKGVTLLLAILVLAAMSILVFSSAAIAINEVIEQNDVPPEEG